MHPCGGCEVEAALVVSLSKHEPEALAALYDLYSRLIYSVLRRITHNEAVTEDLMQEVFLRVWNRAHQFDSTKGTLGAWLLSLTRNIALDYVRSAPVRFGTRCVRVEQVEQWRALNPRFACPWANSVEIEAALSALSVPEKKVMELAYFEGYSQSEIALRLQQPLGTVKSRMRSALAHVRQTVRETPESGDAVAGNASRLLHPVSA
jgi:RNA polymerase sigma-70 factor (ECF subfamily)